MAENKKPRKAPKFTVETYELTIQELENAKKELEKAKTAFTSAMEQAQEHLDHGLTNLKEGTHADRAGRVSCTYGINLPDPSIDKLRELFETASDKLKIRVLDYLGLDRGHHETGHHYLDTPTLLDDLAEDGIKISQQGLAQHLDRLVRDGLIKKVSVPGVRANCYALTDDPYGRLLQHCLGLLHL